MTTNVLEQLAAALAPVMEQQKAQRFGLKHDASGTPTTTGYLHGPGGLLTYPGVDPVMFSTMVGTQSILDMIPARPAVDVSPVYGTITGVGDDVGEEKDGVCDDAPYAGIMQGCLMTSVFGRYERSTPELELNRLGQRNNRADPMDLQLVGSPFANSGIFGAGPMNPTRPGDVLTNEISARFWERNISIHRLLIKQLWTGNPANNTAGGGYKEMTGFSVLVNTGHRDAETNAVCTSMDSLLVSNGYGRVDDPNSTLFTKFVAVYHNLARKAELTGLDPVRWVVAMRSQLFWEITSIWPCSYLTYRCLTSPGMNAPASLNIDANAAIELRDQMRAGKYLMIDGTRLDVVLDDGIPETSGTDNANVTSGCFASDIYFIPMSVTGGRAVTYLEYFDYNNPSLRSALGDNMTIGRVEGPFITTMRQKNWCVEWQSKIEPRLIIRTPWLAARIQNVVYCPAIHDPTAFPGDPYFTLDGVSERQGPSLYTPLW